MKPMLLFLTGICVAGIFSGCETPSSNVDQKSKQSAQSGVTSESSSKDAKGAEIEGGGEGQQDFLGSTADGTKGSAKADGDSNANASDASAEMPKLKFLSWNVESDGADPIEICRQLGALNEEDRYDVFGLTEVMPADLSKFRNALGKHYKYVYSKSGYNDRLQILYNEDVFEKVRHSELKEINPTSRYRSPLVLHLRHRETDKEFLVMLNHLARGKEEIRQQQASLLVEWARNETMPVVAIGDYNFDYVFETKKGNPAFTKMMRDNIWKWVEPEEMIDTNWYDKMNPDGIDDYPGSMLDFAFVANAAKTWKVTCRVIVREGDFPDDETTSDHRPFELVIE